MAKTPVGPTVPVHMGSYGVLTVPVSQWPSRVLGPGFACANGSLGGPWLAPAVPVPVGSLRGPWPWLCRCRWGPSWSLAPALPVPMGPSGAPGWPRLCRCQLGPSGVLGPGCAGADGVPHGPWPWLCRCQWALRGPSCARASRVLGPGYADANGSFRAGCAGASGALTGPWLAPAVPVPVGPSGVLGPGSAGADGALTGPGCASAMGIEHLCMSAVVVVFLLALCSIPGGLCSAVLCPWM